MVYKNVKEVWTDEDFGYIVIVTDTESITINLEVRSDIKFNIQRNKTTE